MPTKKVSAIVVLIIILIVGGYLMWNKKEKVEQVVPETSQVDTSNWKTYKNIEYKYEFQYPPTWKITVVNSTDTTATPLVVDRTNSNVFLVGIIDRALPEIEKEFDAGVKAGMGVKNNILVDNIPAVKYSASDFSINGIFLLFKKKTYQINMYVNSPIPDQILSTFKFTK